MMCDMFFHFLPVNEKYVMFTSFWGQYNDNPKYISMELHKREPEYRQFWAISANRSIEKDLPEYIHVCRYNSLKYYWYKNRSKYVIDNIVGDYSFFGDNIKHSWKIRMKNKKQVNISTWHGNPIKRIGRDLFPGRYLNNDDFFSTSDLLICGCNYVKDIFEKCFGGGPRVEITGTPRCDTMFEIAYDKDELFSKLSIPKGKKVLLYAPTYRNNPNSSGIEQIRSLDIDKLLSLFSKKFGGDWVFVFRVHNSVLGILKNDPIFNNENIINGNLGDDMMEYMQIADAMISDYSGAIFDYTHTERPCFLYALDKKHYINEERGVYMEIENLPYTFAENAEMLYESILNYKREEQISEIHRFNNWIGNKEDGKASKRLVDIIINKQIG